MSYDKPYKHDISVGTDVMIESTNEVFKYDFTRFSEAQDTNVVSLTRSVLGEEDEQRFYLEDELSYQDGSWIIIDPTRVKKELTEETSLDSVNADSKYVSFRTDLQSLINSHSMENGSNTPDFILASFLTEQLRLFDSITKWRGNWYGNDEKNSAIAAVSGPEPVNLAESVTVKDIPSEPTAEQFLPEFLKETSAYTKVIDEDLGS